MIENTIKWEEENAVKYEEIALSKKEANPSSGHFEN
jgi:hypothetical protein